MVGKSYQKNNGKAITLGQSSLSKEGVVVILWAKFLFNTTICRKYSIFGQQLKSIGNTNKVLMGV